MENLLNTADVELATAGVLCIRVENGWQPKDCFSMPPHIGPVDIETGSRMVIEFNRRKRTIRNDRRWAVLMVTNSGLCVTTIRLPITEQMPDEPWFLPYSVEDKAEDGHKAFSQARTRNIDIQRMAKRVKRWFIGVVRPVAKIMTLSGVDDGKNLLRVHSSREESEGFLGGYASRNGGGRLLELDVLLPTPKVVEELERKTAAESENIPDWMFEADFRKRDRSGELSRRYQGLGTLTDEQEDGIDRAMDDVHDMIWDAIGSREGDSIENIDFQRFWGPVEETLVTPGSDEETTVVRPPTVEELLHFDIQIDVSPEIPAHIDDPRARRLAAADALAEAAGKFSAMVEYLRAHADDPEFVKVADDEDEDGEEQDDEETEADDTTEDESEELAPAAVDGHTFPTWLVVVNGKVEGVATREGNAEAMAKPFRDGPYTVEVVPGMSTFEQPNEKPGEYSVGMITTGSDRVEWVVASGLTLEQADQMAAEPDDRGTRLVLAPGYRVGVQVEQTDPNGEPGETGCTCGQETPEFATAGI